MNIQIISKTQVKYRDSNYRIRTKVFDCDQEIDIYEKDIVRKVSYPKTLNGSYRISNQAQIQAKLRFNVSDKSLQEFFQGLLHCPSLDLKPKSNARAAKDIIRHGSDCTLYVSDMHNAELVVDHIRNVIVTVYPMKEKSVK